MSLSFSPYVALAAAIVFEVSGSTLLKISEQFSRLLPTLGVVVCFTLSLYCLSVALKVIPLGIAYAVWAGLGIILTALVTVFLFKVSLDFWAFVGIAMIVAGVLVMNLLSTSVAH